MEKLYLRNFLYVFFFFNISRDVGGSVECKNNDKPSATMFMSSSSATNSLFLQFSTSNFSIKENNDAIKNF